MSRKEIGGLWPAMFTPVDSHGNPAMGELEKLVQLFLKQKMDGLYILGSTGQGFLFSEKQRMEVARRVLEIVDQKIPVIVQVGALNTRESIRLAKEAQKYGAYGISSVGPIYYEVDVDKILEHYSAIGAAIDIPFFPYHIGNHSVFNGEAASYIKKIMALPNIAGMKLTTQNLYEISLIHILSKGKLTLFSGADELLCHATLCGTTGAIGSFFNLWGVECKRVREEFIKGNFDLGNRFMLTFQEVIFKVISNVWSFFREAMRAKYDIDLGMPNPPLGLEKKTWKEKDIIQILEKLESTIKVNL